MTATTARRARVALVLLVLLVLGSTAFVAAPRREARWAPWLPQLALLASSLSSPPALAESSTVSTPSSLEDTLMELMNKATSSLGGGEGGDGQTSLMLLGVGAFVLYGVFALLKFVLAAVGGLFVVREIDQQFGKEGRKTSKLFEKALKRFAGEPADLLEERKIKVVRLNDEVTAFQAALSEQLEGPATGAALRDAARRQRFVRRWQRCLDDVEMSDEQRTKVLNAVQNFQKEEKEREEDFKSARGEWLSALFQNSFLGVLSNRGRVTSSLEKKIKLQEELIANIRKALPDVKDFSNVQKVLQDVDVSWLTDAPGAAPGAHAEAAPAAPGAAEPPKAVYVLSFDGDPTAAGVSLLQQEVTAVLESQVRPLEVVLKLKSPGGTVTGYGLAAAQLLRFRENGIRLVVCVDELAASGGYMMACCAHKILCSPFAAVGSIGVIQGVPNAVERLNREGLKVIQTTAGKWKRTIDPFQAPTKEALAKAEEDVDRIYRQFSSFVKQNRPDINIEEVATGEVWFGADALEKGLVDELQTSSEYILKQIRKGHDVLELSFRQQSGLGGLGSLGALAQLAQLAHLAQQAQQGGLASGLPDVLAALNAAGSGSSSAGLGAGGLGGGLGGLGGLGGGLGAAEALQALQALSAEEQLQQLQAAAAASGAGSAGARAWPKGLAEPRLKADLSSWEL